MTPLHWILIDRIWKDPAEIIHRIALVDYCLERGMNKAARSQQIAIEIVEKSILIIRVPKQKYDPPNYQYYLPEKVFGIVERKKRLQIYEIKRDSRIVLNYSQNNLREFLKTINLFEGIIAHKNIVNFTFRNPCKNIV